MKSVPIKIEWNPDLPIFASELFLKAVGDECGWLGGMDASGGLRCILPYTIVKKAIFCMVRFRVQTIIIGDKISLDDERIFLNNCMKYFHSIGADFVIPASNNAIFRAYPDGAIAAPYGSYVIDLLQPEEILWQNMNRKLRQNINTAKNKGVIIKDGIEHLDAVHKLVRETFKRSNIPFMNYESFRSFVHGLGDYGKVLVADYNGVPHSYAVFAFSNYSAYAIYAGNVANQQQGANKLLYWEAIRSFKQLSVQKYDFFGARINPDPGSKQEALSLFKKRFGAKLNQGYLWKYSLNPFKYALYGLASRLRSGGDIVDAERYKLAEFEEMKKDLC